MKKLFVFLLLGVFLISFASAMEVDNVMRYDKEQKIITFVNAFGLGRDLATAQLKENYCIDGRFCYAEKEITLFEEAELIQDFKTLRIDDDSWEEQNIRWHRLEYWGDIEDFEIQCGVVKQFSNGTEINECSRIKVGNHKGWIEFKEGDIFQEGTYTVRTSGEIKPGNVYDWQVKIHGDWTVPWATWGNISLGSDAEITLNSPIDDFVTLTNEVMFSAMANITGGATLVNMSLWTNETGSWQQYNVTDNISISIESHGKDLTAIAGTQINSDGFRILTSFKSGETGNLKSITTHSSVTANRARLFWDNGTIISSVTITGNTAIFERLLNNDTFYRIEVDSSGASYDRKFSDPLTYPTIGTNMRWTNRSFDQGFSDTRYTNIESLVIELEDVTTSTQTWNRTITDDTIWNVQACDTDSDCGFATQNRTILLDKTKPQINIENPNGTLGYNFVGGIEILNVTFTDGNLDMCWYNYNGTNVTIDGCQTGVKNSTIFPLEENNLNMTLYANDTFGNINSTLTEWNYTYFENNRTHNLTSFETAGEIFSINVEGPTSATLFYNGTEYTTTKSGNDFTRTLQMIAGELGNHSVYWRFDNTQDSRLTYQIVSETVFTLCNATYDITFLNISFKDESDLSVINASIPTSTFIYWLGDGTVTKTLTFINTSVNFNYEFCATPNRTLNFNSLIQYKQGSAYPQRIFSQTGLILTNTTTDLTLYLLGVSDGLFVTFQVFGGQSNALEGVSVSGTRVLEGSDQTVAQGTTDAAGTVTFWLNPDFLHTFTYIKTGFETIIESLFPTQTLYTVTMGSGAVAGVNDTAEGVQITILPQGSFLDKDTFYTFTYTINSSSLDLDEFGFELFYNNGTSIHSDTSTVSTGGTLDKSFNTSNETRLSITYYYITDGTRIEGTTYWLIYEASDFSIYHFLTRVGTYISANIFGILGDDGGYFAKAMLSIVILILVTGSISLRYGLSSEAAVTGLLFGVIFMLNMFNLIPTPDFLSFIELGDFLVFVVAIFTVSRILKEERR